MIIIGIYPDQIENINHTFISLKKEITEFVHPRAVIHLLPFQLSCGDGGFAINDWYSVDDTFGSWADIEILAEERKLIIDGVFNHVGITNEIVKKFCLDPERYKAWFYLNSIDKLKSPRGQDADKEIQTVKGIVKIRQTHMDKTIDINLENPEVLKEINRYLVFLKKKKIWGIRLDAVAYYKKGSDIRHNEGAELLARKIVDLTRNNGFYTIAQLDCDNQGCNYFSDPLYKDVAIYDFSYSAYLCEALISGETEILSRYLTQMSFLRRTLIRAPRTHDGILLKSNNITEVCKAKLVDFSKENGAKVRETQGNLYEINYSLPYLFYLLCPTDVYKLVKFTMAFTGILNSIPYFYYPYILGFIPEIEDIHNVPKRFDLNDPRTINRLPITQRFLTNHPSKMDIKNLLDILVEIRDSLEDEIISGKADFNSIGSCIKVSVANAKIIGYFNFSSEKQQIKVKEDKSYRIAVDSRESYELFNEYDFLIFVKKPYFER